MDRESGSEQYILNPVGVVKSSLKDRSQAPKQGRGEDVIAVLNIREDLEPAMRDVKVGEMIWVLCWFHQADRNVLRTHSKGDKSRPPKGVFSLRSPVRPNPISMSLVEVVDKDGTSLTVKGLEMLDGTPILDIKPHVPKLDL